MKHAQSCGVRELPIPLERLPAEEDEIDQSVADILKVKYSLPLSVDVYSYTCIVDCLIGFSLKFSLISIIFIEIRM